MRKFLSFIFAMLFVATAANAQFSVLLVDDDQNTLESDPIVTALTNWGGTFDVDTTSSTGVPDYTELSNYDMVIWYTGNDGLNLRLWDVSDTAGVGPGAVKFNAGLTEYLAAGGILWIDGLDFIYDIYGGAPDDFAAGDFVYDELGISQYLAQSHADDGTFSDGVQQMDKAAENTITTTDPISWVYSTLWYADGYSIVNDATPLYKMGPAGYDLEGQISAFYYNNLIVSTLRIAKIDPQTDIDQLVSDMIAAAEAGTFAAASSVNEISETSLSIYPNPAANSAVINFSDIKNALELNVFDITGKKVLSQNVKGQNQITVNISNLSTGLYNLIINTDNSSLSTKLSVIK